MKQNKFTIIVPTRERADTLYWCLKTLVAQDYENLEILVSDNFSQDNTKEIVDSFNDKRIRYINTGKRVEMSLNWEFALGHITEGYVGFLGDDDAYLPKSITKINELINITNIKAISWEFIQYHWPKLGFNADILSIPLGNLAYVLQSKKRLKQLYNNKLDIKGLASIYPNGFVHYDVLSKAYTLTGKQFFRSTQPDIYSTLLFSKLLDNYLYSYTPYSIAGFSPKSNTGASTSFYKDSLDESKKNPIDTYWEEQQVLTVHRLLERCFTIEFALVDSIFYVEELFNHGKVSKKLIDKFLPTMFLQSLQKSQYAGELMHNKNIEALTKIADKNNYTKYFQKLLEKYKDVYPIAYGETKTGFSNTTNTLVIKANDYNVTNVYEAALLCSKLLGEQEVFVQQKQYVHHFRYLAYVMQRLQTYL